MDIHDKMVCTESVWDGGQQHIPPPLPGQALEMHTSPGLSVILSKSLDKLSEESCRADMPWCGAPVPSTLSTNLCNICRTHDEQGLVQHRSLAFGQLSGYTAILNLMTGTS